MTPDEIREAAAIARRWRETQGRPRQQRIEATRVEAELERANRRLANLGQAGKRKLNVESVRQIRARVAAGEKLSSVAHAFGVGLACVSMVTNGRRWKEVGV